MMKSARLRLIVVVVLFVGWIAYLGYLALPSVTSREVLSRSQFLVAHLVVIAHIDADPENQPAPAIRVAEVAWPDAKKDLVGKTLTVSNLTGSKGWAGPGDYIVPLVAADDSYRVPAAPRTPGYDGGPTTRFPRIYQATETNRRQLAAVPKPAAK